MKVAIGSTNPTKVLAVEEAFIKNGYTLNVLATSTNSGVREQPMTDEETLIGAMNRAENARVKEAAMIGIGLEGGVTETSFGLMLCNWGALSLEGQPPIIAGGARFLLPEEIAVRLRSGEELGMVMDEYSHKSDVGKKEGAVGFFTNEKVTRKGMFEHVMNLLIGQWEFKKIR
ncbi:DUF84 family protein [Bacillus spongiae]|uniref:inosine/xanthosine triphosphatase n=1 Tax=Bacillus spongiae TaxID=2683610 RepID=A0ABU8HHU8_9BACI